MTHVVEESRHLQFGVARVRGGEQVCALDPWSRIDNPAISSLGSSIDAAASNSDTRNATVGESRPLVVTAQNGVGM